MRNDAKRPISVNAAEQQDLPAGDFSSWLRHTRSALLSESGVEVDCGECIACCSSSQFIQVRPEETRTLGRIRKDILVAAPGFPRGHVLLGYDKKGFCPMMVNGTCSIYEHRPLTCRNYDCRVFTAAGIAAGDGDKARITERVRRWKFSYPTERDCEEHLAVQAAAKFIQEHAEYFPGGKIPGTPGQLAVLAIKVYEVFLKKDGGSAKTGRASSDAEVADAIVEACRTFDARRPDSAYET
jgi:Fe-S-cluster containining protein